MTFTAPRKSLLLSPFPRPAHPARPRAVAFGCALALGLLMAAPAGAARFTVAGASDTVAVAPGQTVTLDLVVRDASPAFNAFDLMLHFDPARLTNVPMSPTSAQRGPLLLLACTSNTPFHRFTATPDSLVCTMVILCSNVSVTGPGTLYHLMFTAAATDAWTTLWFGPGTALYDGGPRVDTLQSRPIVVRIGNPPVLDAGGPPEPPAAAELAPPAPNPARFPGALAVAFRLARADTAELTLLDSLGRRVATVPRTAYGAGLQQLRVSLPRLSPGRYTLVLRTGAGDVRTRPWVVLR